MKTNIDAKYVYEKVKDFFADYSGFFDENKGEVRVEKEGEICLLRIACLGNPEKTIQGALLNRLYGVNGIHPISEYRSYTFMGKNVKKNPAANRSIDIMVFDKQHNPIVAIELKHHSLQSGSVKPLLDGLRNDLGEKSSLLNVPLIQVGLYTHIESIPLNARRDDFLQYRFITSYVYWDEKKIKINFKKIEGRLDFAQTELEKYGLENNFIDPISSFKGRTEVFLAGGRKHEVSGRVNYFLGLRDIFSA